jgi:molybdopterin-guanine dinucleotide biosynthesis protein A
MPSHFNSVAGFVLAGGASRRMGRPKALLILGGETMIERQLRVLRSVTQSVSVLGWPAHLPWPAKLKNLSGVRCLPDSQPGQGPLGGIYTALKHTRSKFNLILGCDMPFVEPGLLKLLCRRAYETHSEVTVPKSCQRRLEPLCAVYSRTVLPVIEAALKAREYTITQFFTRVSCEVIPWREIAAAEFPPQVFDNINAAEDFARAKKSLAAFHRQYSVKSQLKNYAQD